MPVNGDPRRTSGEHTPSFVSYDHFNTFLAEFRRFSGDVTDGVREVREQMIKGTARFEANERAISELRTKQAEIEERQDDSSGKIRTLQQDKKVEEALAAQQAEQSRPRRSIMENVVSTVVTAIILGFLAIAYNAWRDSAIAEREKETTAKPTVPAPAPVNVNGP